MKSNKIRKILKKLKLINNDNIKLFSQGTRDNKNIKVYRDEVTGVIFIDDYLTEKEIYKSGKYRKEKIKLSGKPEYERFKDLKRRLSNYSQFFVGKRIIDFGCGAGDFLHSIKNQCSESCGIEIQRDYRYNLEEKGIHCCENLNELKDKFYDSAFAFHSIEHIDDPVSTLRIIKNKLKKGGFVVIEVPHANDFLLSLLKNDAFKKFTLWSQHLILHTRVSLNTFLKEAGFSDIIVQGVQRYTVSNHLKWLAENKPGGHKSIISSLDSHMLNNAYEASLQKLDATDTLIAIATYN